MQATPHLHRVTLWICGSAAGVCLAQNILPNATFDEGQDQPQGWSLVGASGRRLLKAYGNRSVLMVEGNGKGQTFWRTEPIDPLYAHYADDQIGMLARRDGIAQLPGRADREVELMAGLLAIIFNHSSYYCAYRAG